MKALSVRQPWAHAIVHLGKDIENRTWPTYLRERVAIHASGSMNAHEFHSANSFIKSVNPEFELTEDILTLGAIIGTVEIVDCVYGSKSPWFIGPCGFVLRDPIPVEPIPYRGQLGFWQVPDEIMRRLRFTEMKAASQQTGGS